MKKVYSLLILLLFCPAIIFAQSSNDRTSATKPFTLSAKEKKEGFRILFDGTNMHEWTGNTVDYQLQDGCIVLDPKGMEETFTQGMSLATSSIGSSFS